ncbi:3-oxoacyl-[acyl-carrier-protein] synthase III C-terminal domain-containing protein [Lysobacter tyrosinilyticus]
MPTRFERTWIHATGRFLPGAPVDNEAMDAYVAPLNKLSSRIKRRILGENGILTRHYAIDNEGRTVHSCAEMAAAAIRDCLASTHVSGAPSSLDAIGMLACGTSGGDVLMPGFTSMVQGELSAPPMQILSSHGICASGVNAWEAAASAVELGAHAHAMVAAAEMPSRLFKRSRYAARGYDADFDAHFLRWMLSDGAGALQLTSQPATQGLRLRLRFIHQRSFAGDYPVCMQLGMDAEGGRHIDRDSWQDAEADGALFLRQDIRLLPHLFDVGVHEYAKLAHGGWIDPARVDHFLCHYSSERFAPVVDELMQKAGLAIPRERWFSNLTSRGNTGAASIFIMLDEFLRTRTLRAGEQILCFIPESGRFTVAFVLIEVEAADAPVAETALRNGAADRLYPGLRRDDEHIAPPHDPANAPAALRHLLGELATIWHDYRSRAWRTPVIRKLRERGFTMPDYVRWAENWIPQVREGSKWMREGAASVRAPYEALASLIETHAGDEQNDYEILYSDYRRAGGTGELDALRRNPGGEALNSYLHALAATPNPLGLLGAIYIIEGTGQRIIPALLPLMKASLMQGPDALPADAFRFLEYHGANDEHHLLRWLRAVEIVLEHEDATGHGARAIIETARRTAELYLMQFEHVMP